MPIDRFANTINWAGEQRNTNLLVWQASDPRAYANVWERRFCRRLFSNFIQTAVAAFLLIAALTTQASAATYLAFSLSGDSYLDEVDTEALGKDRTPLVLIHGWNNSTDKGGAPPQTYMWDSFIAYYNSPAGADLKSKYKLYRFGYWSNEVELIQLSTAFRDVLDTVSANDPQQFGSKNISILAHSMGGLIARYYMTKLGGTGRVSKLITLGTPHHGTPIANGLALGSVANPTQRALLDEFNLYLSPIKYYQINRSDLYWDNYDNALGTHVYDHFPGERNDTLNAIQADPASDGKIIAYAGWTAPSFKCDPSGLFPDHSEICQLSWGAGVLSGVFNGMISDGVVPISSAHFYGHTLFRRQPLFPYNHNELICGMNNTDCSQVSTDTKIYKSWL